MIYLDTFLMIMIETCLSKELKHPKTEEEWQAYWQGSLTSYEHALALYRELKQKENHD